MKISEMITDKYKLRIPPTVYYDLLADVQELEEEEEPTTKNDLGVDCISRQAVLNNLLERLKDYKTKKPYITHISIDDLISALQMAKEQQKIQELKCEKS